MSNNDPARQIRADWRLHRQIIDMTEPPAGDNFANGGLAAHAVPLDLRVVILPTDPSDADRIALDSDTAEWIEQNRPALQGGQPLQWGHSTAATSTALVRTSWYNDDQQWDRYLAIHRHGGVEAGLANVAWDTNAGQRVFALRRIVAVMWMVADLQVEAADKWSVSGPWEVSLALRNTAGAALGDFAEGWAPFGDFRHHGTRCREPHLLHRWIVDDIEPPVLALDVGARVENSFGTTHQRHLAHRGEYEARFDPRFHW